MQASDNDITLFGKTNFRNREVPFGIRRDDRRRHMYIIGKTGMGKTTLIENMVIQDILNGHGVCFVDPHGDSVETVLSYIPANRINDVIYLNPADMDFPIAFNPLEAVDERHKHLVASGLMGVFTKIWAGVWSPRMEYILQNTILALLDSPGNTMLGVARMYVDKAYRKKIVDNIKDPVVRSFWVDEFANYQDKFRTEAVAPIQNKVGQFLSNAIIRNIVGQTKSTIDLRQIMDDKKILLLNLSKGRIGEDSSALLGAMIITKLQLAAMSRVDIPESEREDFYLYVDEFQNFATESFASILSEARKYRLNLIVAHQYIGQLVQDRNTVVRDAIFGNVGTMITFRVGADDAEFLEKEFEPTYLLNDLVNLSKWSIYLKLMINGVSSNPFSASTLPPISEPTGNMEKVIKVSRERYAADRVTVETKISKWLGAEFHAEAAKVESQSVNEEGVADELRFKHETQKAIATPVPSPSLNRTQQSSQLKPAAQNLTSNRVAPVRSAPAVSAVTPSNSATIKPTPAPRPVPSAPISKPASSLGSANTSSLPKPFVRPVQNTVPAKPVFEMDEDEPRRSLEKSTRPKHNNPIWETVTKLTTEKIKDSVHKTNQALEALSKGLQDSVVKDPPKFPEAPKIKPREAVEPPKFKAPEIAIKNPVEKAPAPHVSKAPERVEIPVIEKPKTIYKDAEMSASDLPDLTAAELDLGYLADPKLPEDHIHPDDQTKSPHHNIQSIISKHGSLEPGDTVKFD